MLSSFLRVSGGSVFVFVFVFVFVVIFVLVFVFDEEDAAVGCSVPS